MRSARLRGAVHGSPPAFAANRLRLRMLVRFPVMDGGVVRASRTRERLVALSFDDGPSAANTPGLLEILARNDARATFFMVGIQAEAHPELARAVVEAGHEVGNHSYSHAHPSSMSLEALEQDLERAATSIESAAGVAPTLVRPPFGKRARDLVPIAARRRGRVVLWAVDSGDAAGLSVDQVVREAVGRIHPGDIVLLHDGGDARPVTIGATSSILESLGVRGFRFVTISELLAASRGR